MATIFTHCIVPGSLRLLLGKEKVSGALLFYACLASVLPDADVVAFSFNIPYESQFGHRGFTHSLFFALCVALIGSVFHDHMRSKPAVVFWVLFISLASHPVLDSLTNGGRGVAIFWPFSSERFFLPWQPVEVSPIGIRNFLNPRGLDVLRSEFMVIWLPSLVVVLSAVSIKRLIDWRKSSGKQGVPAEDDPLN